MNIPDTNIRKPKVKLIGRDGNAYFILGAVEAALRKVVPKEVVDAYLKEATSGDYNHLLATTAKYVEII